MNLHKSTGFTLLEMTLVLGLMSFLTLMAASSKQIELEHTKAKNIGNTLFQYNNAARSWLSSNVGAPDSVKTGTAWLKDTSCGGSSPIAYLPCNFPAATVDDPLDFSQMSFTTSIQTTGTDPNKITTIRTTTTPIVLAGGNIRSDLSGLAAIVASAGSSVSETPSLMATDGSFRSNPLTGVITMLASNNANEDSWLRTDGSNTMNSNITFNQSKSALFREINNVSRIKAIAGQILSIGSTGGAALGYSVVVDADMTAYGNLNVSKSVVADVDVTAERNMRAKRFYDFDNNAFYVDPASESKVSSIDADSDIKSRTSVTAPVFYDRDSNAFRLDMNANSILSSLNIKSSLISEGVSRFDGKSTFNEEVQLNRVVSNGSGCATNGALARDFSGMTLSCQNGIWASGGAVEGKYTYLGWYTGGAFLTNGSKPAIVYVSGGSASSCGGDGENRFNLSAIVSGMQVAYSTNNNSSFAKVGFISFGVPANATYSITSSPYDCPSGNFRVFSFAL